MNITPAEDQAFDQLRDGARVKGASRVVLDNLPPTP